MYCKYCGKKISENSKFCIYCGKKLNSNEDKEKKNTDEVIEPSTKPAKESTDTKKHFKKEYLTKLQKRYKDTGNTSIAISILALLITFFLSLSEYDFVDVGLEAIISIPILIPFYYFGKKIKEEGLKNLEYSLKVSRGMLIYTIAIVLINLALGEVSGWLWFILIYYYYKTYKETKDVVSGSGD